MTDPTPSNEGDEPAGWFCTMPRGLGRCFGPNTAPGHHACCPTGKCPSCDGNGCEEGCGRHGGCEDAYSGPDSHKACRSCSGRGWIEIATTAPVPPAPSSDDGHTINVGPVTVGAPSSDTPSDERREWRSCAGAMHRSPLGWTHEGPFASCPADSCRPAPSPTPVEASGRPDTDSSAIEGEPAAPPTPTPQPAALNVARFLLGTVVAQYDAFGDSEHLAHTVGLIRTALETDLAPPSTPAEQPQPDGPGPANCARRSHWIGSHVGNTEQGYGHDGGYTKTPCISFEVAADCDPLAVACGCNTCIASLRGNPGTPAPSSGTDAT